MGKPGKRPGKGQTGKRTPSERLRHAQLKDPDPKKRVKAARFFLNRIYIKKPAGLKNRLLKLVREDPDFRVRSYGIRSLAAFNLGPEGLSVLKKVAEKDPYPSVRKDARQAIEQIEKRAKTE